MNAIITNFRAGKWVAVRSTFGSKHPPAERLVGFGLTELEAVLDLFDREKEKEISHQ